MLLPSSRSVSSRTPIYLNSNFTWGEATKNCTRKIENLVINGSLIMTATDIEHSIVRTAKELDRVRAILGNRPILINSWYRPAKDNRAVGGAVYSRHQYGDAVDIRSSYYSPQAIYNLLDKIHTDGGMGRYYNFVHIDYRGRKTRWHG